MNRNMLYFVIAILVIVLAGIAYYAWQESQRTVVQVQVDDGGIRIEGG